jgi:hypothetical protein
MITSRGAEAIDAAVTAQLRFESAEQQSTAYRHLGCLLTKDDELLISSLFTLEY